MRLIDSELANRIESAFPATRCTGPITNFDNQEGEEFDEDQFLFKGLSGRTWKEVPRQFVREHPGSIVLLGPNAFPKFLPIWMLCAMEDMDRENEVRELLIYSFCPKRDLIPDTSFLIRDRLREMNSEQRQTVRAFLAYCSSADSSPFVRAQASRAVEFIDNENVSGSRIGAI